MPISCARHVAREPPRSSGLAVIANSDGNSLADRTPRLQYCVRSRRQVRGRRPRRADTQAFRRRASLTQARPRRVAPQAAPADGRSSGRRRRSRPKTSTGISSGTCATACSPSPPTGSVAVMNEVAYRILGLEAAHHATSAGTTPTVLKDEPDITRMIAGRVRAVAPAQPRRAAAEDDRQGDRLHAVAGPRRRAARSPARRCSSRT